MGMKHWPASVQHWYWNNAQPDGTGLELLVADLERSLDDELARLLAHLAEELHLAHVRLGPDLPVLVVLHAGAGLDQQPGGNQALGARVVVLDVMAGLDADDGGQGSFSARGHLGVRDQQPAALDVFGLAQRWRQLVASLFE